MACHEACQFKHEAYFYRKEYEKLKSKVELGKLEQTLEAVKKARCNALNERDRLQRRLEEQTQTLNRYKEEMSLIKKHSDWKEEELEAKLKEEHHEASLKIRELKKEIGQLQKELQDQIWKHEKQQKEMEREHKKEIRKLREEYETEINKLKEESVEKDKTIQLLREHLQDEPEGKTDISQHPKVNNPGKNSTNSSVPPGQDPNHAIITNNRKSSGKKAGAQEGHEFHPRKKLKADHVVLLPTPQEVKDHPDDYYRIEDIVKQRISLTINLEVTEYVAERYRNHQTREIVHSDFPAELGHLEVNYDNSVDALVAYLHSVCAVPYGKIQELLREATEGELELSTGKLANLEKRFSELSEDDRSAIGKNLFRGNTMNIDGTMVRINGKLKQILVMCNSKNVLYIMTGCKGDKALEGTPVENYQGTTISDSEATFTKCGSKNQRCLVHEGRYLNRAEQDTPDLQWSYRMQELFQRIQHVRHIEMKAGKECMARADRKKVYAEYDTVILQGLNEYRAFCPDLLNKHLVLAEKKLDECAVGYGIDFSTLPHPLRRELKSDEVLCPQVAKDALGGLVKDINMLIRYMEAKDNYLLFLTDYSISPENNAAEKNAREVKTHVKPNGGMRSEAYAGFYADTASVLQTGRKNGQSRLKILADVFSRTVKVVKQKMMDRDNDHKIADLETV